MQGKTDVLSQLAPDEWPGFTNIVDVRIPRVVDALLTHLLLSSTVAIARIGISVWVESLSIESYPPFASKACRRWGGTTPSRLSSSWFRLEPRPLSHYKSRDWHFKLLLAEYQTQNLRILKREELWQITMIPMR